MQPMAPPAPPPGGRPKRNPNVVALVVLAILGICGLFVGSVALFEFTSTELPVTDADRDLLLCAEDLKPYVDIPPLAPGDEVFTKLRYLDGSLELSYEYDPPEGGYMFVRISQELKASDALIVYTTEKAGLRIGLALEEGTELRPREDVFRAGDASTFHDIVVGGLVVGHSFVARIGKVIYAVAISGYDMGQPAIWQGLMAERLKAPRLTD